MGGRLVVLPSGVLWVGRGVEVKIGTEDGVRVKVAVSGGRGVAVFSTGSVGEMAGLAMISSGVGVA